MKPIWLILLFITSTLSAQTDCDLISISGGASHSLALKNDGTVWAWGWNNRGQLGDGTNTAQNIAVQASNLNGVIAISSGDGYSLALKNDGAVWAWGSNSNGELGNGANGFNTDQNIPVQTSNLNGIIAISSGYGHSVALKNDGTVWA